MILYVFTLYTLRSFIRYLDGGYKYHLESLTDMESGLILGLCAILVIMQAMLVYLWLS